VHGRLYQRRNGNAMIKERLRELFRFGDQIAVGLLEEQKLTYGENFFLTVPFFNGSALRI
jgi:hypothetical protein